MTPTLRAVATALLAAPAAALPLAGPGAGPAAAQDLFSPVIVVNDRVVTGWELDQRTRLLAFFNQPATAEEIRRELVDDRLREQELDRVGVSLTEEGLASALEEFAARADLSADRLATVLEQSGVAPETLRDYVAVNSEWREYVRQRFGGGLEVSEADVDARLGSLAQGPAGLEVLLGEIVIPAPPGQEGRAQAVAEEVAGLTSAAPFRAAAREVSAVPSRERGGDLDWAPITNYPPPIQALLLSLAPGEVTPPLALQGAVALLQLRDLRETAVPAPAPEAIDYAVLRLASAEEAAALLPRLDRCDDLYGAAQGLPPDRLRREAAAPGAIPQDEALALAALDADEATILPGPAGVRLVMLCAREYPLPEGAPDREAIRLSLEGERLQGYADALLADLRAAATIVGE